MNNYRNKTLPQIVKLNLYSTGDFYKIAGCRGRYGKITRLSQVTNNPGSSFTQKITNLKSLF